MKRGRRRHSAEFKAKVALEAIRGVKSVNELGSRYGIHPTQIGHWKKQALEGLSGIFVEGRTREEKAEEELKAQLYQQIGQLLVELEWLKKTAGSES